MSILNFLAPSKTVSVQIDLDRDEYEALEALFRIAKKKDPDFNPSGFLGAVIMGYMQKHYGKIINNMLNYDKPQKKGRQLRG